MVNSQMTTFFIFILDSRLEQELYEQYDRKGKLSFKWGLYAHTHLAG